MPGGASTLVIGYGNDLRGDDAAGRRAAEAVRTWGRPGVRVLSVHQLTPDLAAAVADARLVLFLDAHPAEHSPDVHVRRVTPHASATPLGHTDAPGAILEWTRLAFTATPEAWWITMPAERFEFGAPLSERTAAAVVEALEHVRRLLDPAQDKAAGAPDPPAPGAAPGLPDRRNGPCPTR